MSTDEKKIVIGGSEAGRLGRLLELGADYLVLCIEEKRTAIEANKARAVEAVAEPQPSLSVTDFEERIVKRVTENVGRIFETALARELRQLLPGNRHGQSKPHKQGETAKGRERQGRMEGNVVVPQDRPFNPPRVSSKSQDPAAVPTGALTVSA